MPFFPIMDFWIANEFPVEQSLPQILDEESSTQETLPNTDGFKILPYELQGSVENFDSIARASFLAKTFPKKWCGTYISFNESSKLNLTLNFSEVEHIGQLVNLRGEMLIGDQRLSLQGNLNAKSDQLELLITSGISIAGLEPGSNFLGLQGLSLLGWKSTRLNNPGGKLEIHQECNDKVSESPAVIGIW